MKRVRHLTQVDYVIPVGQRLGQALALSNQSNVMLERTWHQNSHLPNEVTLHAKFNASLMDGIQFIAELKKGSKTIQSALAHFVLSVVNPANWTETFISNVVASNSNGTHTATINQATLGLNELSGKQVYSVSVEIVRKRFKYRKKIYINHLGCFDSLIRLRQNIELLQIEKLDE